RHHRINQPQSRLLRQCPDGKLLPYPEDRARSSSPIQDPRRGPARYLRLHRGLLQSNPTPFRHRIYRPDRDGAKSSLTLSTFFGGRSIIFHRPLRVLIFYDGGEQGAELTNVKSVLELGDAAIDPPQSAECDKRHESRVHQEIQGGDDISDRLQDSLHCPFSWQI